MAAVAGGVAILTAYGSMIMSLEGRMFAAQASMVTQEQLRFELTHSHDRVGDRLDSIETLLFILLERDNAAIQ